MPYVYANSAAAVAPSHGAYWPTGYSWFPPLYPNLNPTALETTASPTQYSGNSGIPVSVKSQNSPQNNANRSTLEQQQTLLQSLDSERYVQIKQFIQGLLQQLLGQQHELQQQRAENHRLQRLVSELKAYEEKDRACNRRLKIELDELTSEKYTFVCRFCFASSFFFSRLFFL
jgi:hypothetical protein